MADITDRNVDLPDLIVNLQRASQSPTPISALQLYVYQPVPATPDIAIFSETVTATPSGLHYYAGVAGGGHDEIICGYFTAS